MQLQVPWYVNRTWTSIAFVKGKQLAMPFFTQVADWKAFLKKATWPSWWHHSPNFIYQGISSMEHLPTYRIIKLKKWKGLIFPYWNLASKFWVILKNGNLGFCFANFWWSRQTFREKMKVLLMISKNGAWESIGFEWIRFTCLPSVKIIKCHKSITKSPSHSRRQLNL